MFRSIAATYREAFSGLSRSVWLLSVASLVNRAGTMVMPFLVLYLVEKRGFTTTQAGQTLALYGLGAMVASYCGGLAVRPLRSDADDEGEPGGGPGLASSSSAICRGGSRSRRWWSCSAWWGRCSGRPTWRRWRRRAIRGSGRAASP